jgi:hypothetical protein
VYLSFLGSLYKQREVGRKPIRYSDLGVAEQFRHTLSSLGRVGRPSGGGAQNAVRESPAPLGLSSALVLATSPNSLTITGDAAAMVRGQDAVGRFSRSEQPSQDDDGGFLQ